MRVFKKLLILAAVALPLVSASPVTAQGASGLSISPTRSELEINAGEEKTFEVSIKNVSGGAITAQPRVNDFTSDGVSGEPKIAADEAEALPSSIKGFLPQVDSVDLEADETKKVTVTAKVPADTNPGSYYGLLRYTAVPKGSSGDGQVSLAAGIGVIVLITVPGDLTQKISVSSIQAAEGGKVKSFFTKAPNEVFVKVRNIGTAFAKPYSKVTISSLGKDVVTYDMNNEEPRGNVLPGDEREFKNSISGISRPGKYTVKAVTSIYADNASSDILVSESSFWYIPMWMFIVAGVLLLLLILGAFLGYRKFSHGKR